MTTTLTDWKLNICKDIDLRNIPDWLKTNCQTIIVNLPDNHKNWENYHVELFLKAICTGIPKKRKNLHNFI